MKMHLARIRLNSGGYDRTGAYWGHGPLLWQFETDDGETFGTLRALTRDQAKASQQRGKNDEKP